MKILTTEYGQGCYLTLAGNRKVIDCTKLSRKETEKIIDNLLSVGNPWVHVKVSNFVYNQIMK